MPGDGLRAEAIDAIIAERKDAAKRAKDAKPLEKVGRPDKDIKGSDTTLKEESRDAEYLTRRIARDNPELLERMKSGEFKSSRDKANRCKGAPVRG